MTKKLKVLNTADFGTTIFIPISDFSETKLELVFHLKRKIKFFPNLLIPILTFFQVCVALNLFNKVLHVK